ncbi:MAG: hypothetical protein KIH69_003100 [Anaerolineae bacterium]|nr:hypothetical protein [Anaerolineae bacterium]
MENKSNYKKPVSKLSQIAARIALRTATKIATESIEPRKLSDSVATQKAPGALNLAHETIDTHYINRIVVGGES